MNVIKPNDGKIQVRIITNCLDYFKGVGEGIRRVAKANFSDLPEIPNWNEVLCLGVMIDGYEVARKITDEHIENFHRAKESEFEKSGVWSGTASELWTVLFYYNRKNHWNEGYGFDDGSRNRNLAVTAYHALRIRLQNPLETTGIDFKIT